jgi:hypothetical protein
MSHHIQLITDFNVKTHDNGALSQETILKIQERKRLVYTYPIHFNPDAVIKCVIYFSINGDNIDEKLEQLRTIDSAMEYPCKSDNVIVHLECKR